jgi:hypothetical protein
VKNVVVTVVAKLGNLEPDAFWFVMDNRNWMHPLDDQGRRRPYKDLSKSVADLVDDPFRSLAGELRRAGGFAKDTAPFSEFLWSEEADFLPGGCGPVPTWLIPEDSVVLRAGAHSALAAMRGFAAAMAILGALGFPALAFAALLLVGAVPLVWSWTIARRRA